jgi:hypothetical protein
MSLTPRSSPRIRFLLCLEFYFYCIGPRLMFLRLREGGLCSSFNSIMDNNALEDLELY